MASVSNFVPDPIHTGGLRYHGMAPLISHVYELGLMDDVAMGQLDCFAAGVQFARTEGIVPARNQHMPWPRLFARPRI